MSEFKARIETESKDYLVLDSTDLAQLGDALGFDALQVQVNRLARRVAKLEEKQSTRIRPDSTPDTPRRAR